MPSRHCRGLERTLPPAPQNYPRVQQTDTIGAEVYTHQVVPRCAALRKKTRVSSVLCALSMSTCSMLRTLTLTARSLYTSLSAILFPRQNRQRSTYHSGPYVGENPVELLQLCKPLSALDIVKPQAPAQRLSYICQKRERPAQLLMPVVPRRRPRTQMTNSQRCKAQVGLVPRPRGLMGGG